ncbi:hypothetical protein HJC23_009210 [Cyclotella cryptica]|uniref:Apple domain-containing protein n=1 Tax=Cyclotella cryptica TaxID=29204 RepID=A0ABD3P0T3_9STRA|eukprot:CCRYP_018274-RA/>CCRYP_018274-RA protein AED:0.01 eAED:0.01 QI:165/-1/1/1/-1/1/1/243/281
MPQATTYDSGKRKPLGNTTIVAAQRCLSLRSKRPFLLSSIFLSVIVVFLPRTITKLSNGLSRKPLRTAVPPCPSSPWKPNESLQGNCQGGGIQPNPSIATATECASSCCSDPACITFQFRSDVGCLQGGDVRLGMEKDGTPTWCSDSPPLRWRGQYLVPRVQGQDGKDVVYSDAEKGEFRKKSCDLNSWSPDERPGQCFGLGSKRVEASASDVECMKACCADPNCGAWQWSREAGCYYGKWMFGCLSGESVMFEPFVGRRKFQESRTYSDASGRPWQQTLS